MRAIIPPEDIDNYYSSAELPQVLGVADVTSRLYVRKFNIQRFKLAHGRRTFIRKDDAARIKRAMQAEGVSV